MDLTVGSIEVRLQKRYKLLVKQHLATTQEVAAGGRALLERDGSFAAAQAAWRFYQNPATTLPTLAEPLIAAARDGVARACESVALVAHDWSPLGYTTHPSKTDRIAITHRDDVGYELQTALVVSDGTGAPLAPVYQGVLAADGIHSTRRERVVPYRPHLDEVGRTMGYVEGLGLGKPVVHIIDREADSVLHLRRWSRQRRAVLVRADDVRRVLWQGRDVLLSEVVDGLEPEFRSSREVEIKGTAAAQYVAEAEVTLHRAAKLHRVRDGKRVRKVVTGKPLTVRLVVSQVRDHSGAVLAQWLLWTNLPATVSAETVALWYYWRWKIESFFKLLKRAGQHAEQWQQESAEAIAKRMLVASQACVVVWALARSREPEAEPARALLVRLSGRLMKRSRPFTEPALLAGMWVLMAMLDALDRYSIDELKRLAAFILPTFDIDSG